MIQELDKTANLVLCDKVKESIGVHKYSILYHAFKRTFDFICALIGCLFLLPITIIIKICYMISGDFHSIFYIQDRIGLNGKTFRLYKYRSMIPNADEALKEILKKDKVRANEYKINKKLENDPRITRVGRFIRNCSIDELPQLLNLGYSF